MEKDTLDNYSHKDLLRKFILRGEPSLSENERKRMWKNIEKRAIYTSRRHSLAWKWYVAAAVLVIATVSSLLFQKTVKSDPYVRMADLVDIDTVHCISLFLGDQQAVFDSQVEVRCQAEANQVNVKYMNGASFKLSSPKQNKVCMLVVPKGEKADVLLADGSMITIREQSKFCFPLHFKGENRKVYLEGEAYLKVTPNADKQFVTETPDMNVGVLGTEFLISVYPTVPERSVLLVSGRVEVESVQGDRHVLSPNQRYVFNPSARRSSLDSDVDPSIYVCWKENLLRIEDEPLSDVLKKLESVYNTKFEYDLNELAKVHISGKLDTSVPVDELLDRLAKIAPVKLDETRKKISLNEKY